MLVLAVAGLWMVGCEEDDFDHPVPQGMAGLVVDNRTGSRLEVFIDGASQGTLRPWRHRIWDLRPGVHRLAIRDRDGGGFIAEDADLIEGRLTIAEVYYGDDIRVPIITWRLK